MKSAGNRSLFLSLSLPVLALVAGVGVTFGVLRMRSDSPSVERSALQLVKVQSGPIVCRVQGLDAPETLGVNVL